MKKLQKFVDEKNHWNSFFQNLAFNIHNVVTNFFK